MFKFLTMLLTSGATASVGILSYIGALAVGFPFGFAIFAGFITAGIESQVFLSNIQGAFKNLESDIENKKYKKIFIFAIISLLFAISFGASTFNSAVALVPFIPFVVAAIIGSVSTVAWGAIMYYTLNKTSQLFYNKDNKTLSKLRNILLFTKQNNNNKSWLYKINTLLTSLFTYCFIALSGYLLIATAPMWLGETKSGLELIMAADAANVLRYITAPFAIVLNNVFLFSNAVQTIIVYSKLLRNSDPIKSIKKTYKDIKSSPAGLKYNPAFWLIKIISVTMFISLNIAHSVCQALIAGRTSLATLAGAFSDFLCDLHFTGGHDKDSGCHQHSHQHSHNHNHSNYDHHSHFLIDTLVVASQVVATLPLQALAVPINYYISENISENNKTLSQCTKESFSFIDDYMSKNFYPKPKT